jgi:hypothetical protein
MFGLTVATAAPASAGVDRQVTVHYNRPDGNYSGWNMWLFGKNGNADESIDLTLPFEFNGEDSFGKSATFTVTNDDVNRIGFIVRTNDWVKDPADSPDRFFDLPAEGTTEIWVISGDSTVYTSNPYRTVTIHYNRPDNNYSGWNMWLFGKNGNADESIDLELPFEFNGEDAFGKTATFTVKNPLVNRVGFIVRTNDWVKDPADSPDRFITLPASGNAEVWVKSGDLTVYTANPDRTVTIHYNRPDDNYTGWNMWLFGKNGNADESIDLELPFEFNGEDSFGKSATFTVKNTAVTRVGFIVRTNDWVKDPADSPDRFIDLPTTGHVEVWLKSGDLTVYTSDPRGRTVVIHYWRPLADYDIWNLWLFGKIGNDDAALGVINPAEFDGEDANGLTYTLLVEDPAITRVGIIVRTNDWVKDTPNDRFINLTDAPKQEIWLKQGIVSLFYSNPWGDDPTVQRATIRLSGLTASSVASLPAKTNRGSQIKWISYTPATCAITGGHNLRTYRPGACRIVGKADATEVARAATFKRTVTVT